ncbi:hypothetical protein PAHAL_7G281100 [Panicum hallii]|jgi:hypothetical protein|uniref:Uncharacterized protein n=1 Tax=Panicum hallii TaxID=206008 RepID=A0A2T8IDN0_9POAL|nr:hypothetical protein PAHAL_7G281100 [Panicum hallii]
MDRDPGLFETTGIAPLIFLTSEGNYGVHRSLHPSFISPLPPTTIAQCLGRSVALTAFAYAAGQFHRRIGGGPTHHGGHPSCRRPIGSLVQPLDGRSATNARWPPPKLPPQPRHQDGLPQRAQLRRRPAHRHPSFEYIKWDAIQNRSNTSNSAVVIFTASLCFHVAR